MGLVMQWCKISSCSLGHAINRQSLRTTFCTITACTTCKSPIALWRQQDGSSLCRNMLSHCLLSIGDIVLECYVLQCRWKASWQLTDAFETWRAGARHKHDMRIKTATAFEYLYLSLGQRALKAWQQGVAYNQKVTCCACDDYWSSFVIQHLCLSMDRVLRALVVAMKRYEPALHGTVLF